MGVKSVTQRNSNGKTSKIAIVIHTDISSGTNEFRIEYERLTAWTAQNIQADNYCAKMNRILLAKLFSMQVSSLEFTMQTNCCCCDNEDDEDNVEDNVS